MSCLQPIAYLSGWLLVAAWGFVLALPLLAWALAALFAGSGPGSRARRAARALGPAVATTAAVVTLFHLASLASRDLAAGPFRWLDLLGVTAPSTPAGSPGPGGIPLPICLPPRGSSTDALLFLAMLSGYLLALASLFWSARLSRSEPAPFRFPAAAPLRWALLAAAALSAWALTDPVALAGRDAVLLDILGLLPLSCVALALYTLASEEREAPKAPAPVHDNAQPPPVDAAALLRSVGAIEGDGPPLFSVPPLATPAGGGANADLWRAVGGAMAHPGALDEVSRALAAPFTGALVGDLPDPTSRLFLAAVVLRAMRIEGLPCLVVTDDVSHDIDGTRRCALKDTVEAAIKASGAWSSGALVVGDKALREAIAGKRMPAAVFIDVDELSAAGVRALGRNAGGDGTLWAARVGLVIVDGIDRGDPLRVTHRMLTLRRLGLALRASGARWSVVATGLGGPGTRALVEQSFAGHVVRDVPFAPRSSAAVLAWPAAPRFVASHGPAWPRRAIEPLVRAGLSVSVGDPGGTLDLRSVEVDVGKVKLVRDITLDGQASIAVLDDSWLLSSFRALPNRMSASAADVHHALWGFTQSPFVSFLLRPGTLTGLSQQGRLPSPRPLVGHQNRLLVRAHLAAALREGEQDRESLRAVFGHAEVEQALGQQHGPERFTVRSVPGRDGLLRVPLAPAVTGDVKSPVGATVSDAIVQVLQRHGRRALAQVDALVAATRFYPGRVFAVAHERFEVPLEGRSAAPGEIVADLVDPQRPLTQPLLRVSIDDATPVEPPLSVRTERIAYRLATLEATIREEVSGVVAAGRSLTYAPVNAQYRSRLRVISFDGQPAGLAHLAASLDDALLALLLASRDDLQVIVGPPGLLGGPGASIAIVDRHVQGIGVAEALDPSFVDELLLWVRAVLSSCSCVQGCERCTPLSQLTSPPDKASVLRLLGA